MIGPDRNLMIDANQVWEVDQAIAWVRRSRLRNPGSSRNRPAPTTSKATARFAKAFAPVKVATGEMCQNRIMFKQFIMRGAIDVVQIDACRLGGVNEILAVLLMAAKYELRCPHAGGVACANMCSTSR